MAWNSLQSCVPIILDHPVEEYKTFKPKIAKHFMGLPAPPLTRSRAKQTKSTELISALTLDSKSLEDQFPLSNPTSQEIQYYDKFIYHRYLDEFQIY